jgi:hypothetical protein
MTPDALTQARTLLAELVALLDGATCALPAQTLSVTEFSRECGRGTDWVYDQIRRRRITPCRVGKPYRIPRSELSKLSP